MIKIKGNEELWHCSVTIDIAQIERNWREAAYHSYIWKIAIGNSLPNTGSMKNDV